MRKNILSKRIITLLTIIVMLFSLVGCSGDKPNKTDTDKKELKLGMVTDNAGIGDQGFNDSAHSGLKRAESELGAKISVVESTEMNQYVTNLNQLAQQKYDLIVGVGYLLVDAIGEAAQQNLDSNFLLVDAAVEGDNIMSVLFNENEGSFLAGAAAGLMTKNNKVGFVGGMNIPPVEKWRAGFEAGVKTTNPDAEIVVTFVDSFGDPNKAKQLALTQFNSGVDIIMHVGGQSGLGVIQAAKEKGEGYYVIASDADQNSLAPDNVIASIIKGVDNAVFDASKLVSEGNFKAGTVVMGLKEGGVRLSDTSRKTLPKDVLEKVEKLEKMVIDGQVKLPSNMEEMSSFTPPEI